METAFELADAHRRWGAGAGGGTGETREMLGFCAERGITAETEILPVREVNTALDRLARNVVRYRGVLDLAG